jgi:transcriptional regulator with XRE-family HTH domain
VVSGNVAGRLEISLTKFHYSGQILSTIVELNVDQRIAARVRELRAEHGLSLDALAMKSRVSRSMISGIERSQKSPTAVVLDKLAAALGVTLGSLFDGPAFGPAVGEPVARHRNQPEWQDAGSGYVRRNISPPGVSQPMQLVEVHFPAFARVAFESSARESRIHQQIWMLKGTMVITIGAQRYRVYEGDCLAMDLDRPTTFYNPREFPARYVVAIAAEKPSKRRPRQTGTAWPPPTTTAPPL